MGSSWSPPASWCKRFNVDNAYLKSERFLTGWVSLPDSLSVIHQFYPHDRPAQPNSRPRGGGEFERGMPHRCKIVWFNCMSARRHWTARDSARGQPGPSSSQGSDLPTWQRVNRCEWQHGWQYWSSSVTDVSFRKLTLLSGRTASSRAHLRSHSGRNTGVALAHCPTTPEFTIQPHLFRTLLLERLRLPLQIMEASCEGCQAPLDLLGFHRASCPRSGRVEEPRPQSA